MVCGYQPATAGAAAIPLSGPWAESWHLVIITPHFIIRLIFPSGNSVRNGKE